jgi:hypothetical protein
MSQNYGKTFGMSRPSEYLDKLEWEYERLMKAGAADATELGYHTLNFLITAWHMTDWTYPYLTASVKAKFPKLRDFQDWVKNQSRELAATRDLATGGKHWRVDRNPDSQIETISVTQFHPSSPNGVIGDVWCIAIDGGLLRPDDFCQNIITFWTGVLKMNDLWDDFVH